MDYMLIDLRFYLIVFTLFRFILISVCLVLIDSWYFCLYSVPVYRCSLGSQVEGGGELEGRHHPPEDRISDHHAGVGRYASIDQHTPFVSNSLVDRYVNCFTNNSSYFIKCANYTPPTQRLRQCILRCC